MSDNRQVGTMENPVNKHDSTDNINEGSQKFETELRRIGCCKYCILRFKKVWGGPEYRVSTAESPASDNSFCCVCLGLLESAPGFLSRIKEDVVSQGYQTKTFCIAVVTPVEITIREMIIRTHFRNQFPNMPLTDLPLAKDALRWQLNNAVADMLHAQCESDGDLQIKLVYEHADTANDWKFIKDMSCFRDSLRNRKRNGEQDQPPSIQLLEETLSSTKAKLELAHFKSYPPLKVTTPMNHISYIECLHRPAFVGGRYLKFSRHLSQTPWVIDGERKSEHSVEELLAGAMSLAFQADSFKFCSAGREDVDVRCLGGGRPFAIEFINPRVAFLSETKLREIQTEINEGQHKDLVGVKDLKMVSRQALTVLKEGEKDKRKVYCCIIWTSSEVTEEHQQKLEAMKDLKLKQDTPIRVMHRRNLATRTKTVYWMKCQRLEPNFIKMWLCTEAGTYIKEFVHGDFGRTTPSVGELLSCEADIISLDVVDVLLEWPP
eukprot:m.94324 g.94324  ORF g.94324 m.94324 type:complete len:491 (-) comp13440_c0_seq2:198-1670(-)